jgi:hypothetical protein
VLVDLRFTLRGRSTGEHNVVRRVLHSRSNSTARRGRRRVNTPSPLGLIRNIPKAEIRIPGQAVRRKRTAHGTLLSRTASRISAVGNSRSAKTTRRSDGKRTTALPEEALAACVT